MSTVSRPARQITIKVPGGPFTLVLADDDAVISSGWTADVDELLPQVHPSLRPSGTVLIEPDDPAARAIDAVQAALAWADGELTAIDAVPVRQRSGPFLEAAWDALRQVRPGQPVSYAELAVLAGRPDATRAAASACARNACALFVPCHRVLRTGGALGGFRWGLDVKAAVLAHEAPDALPL